jgi:integrase
MADLPIHPATSNRYSMIALNLIERFMEANGRGWRYDSKTFAKWMNETIAPSVGRSTRRQYRAALTYHYTVNGHDPAFVPSLRIPAHKRQVTEPPLRTSSRKPKGFKPGHFDRLTKALGQSNAYMAHVARLTLIASTTTGLRPREWFDATLETEEFGNPCESLLVQNAKHTQGRSHGPTRRINLGWSTDDKVEMLIRDTLYPTIHAFRIYARETAANNGYDNPGEMDTTDYERMVKSMNQAMQKQIKRHCERLKLPAYTLYSARHQFAADAKQGGLTKVEA